MDPVLYSAVDGGSNDLVRQGVIANNLANLNTPGFRSDLYQAEVMYLKDENGNNKTTGQTYIVQLPTTVNMAPGEIRTTGRDWDIAVGGNGFIAVQTAGGGEAYIKGGSFRVDVNGQLVTASGNAVLGDGGPISIPPARSIEIGSDGTISVVPLTGDLKGIAVLDRLKTVSLDPSNVTRTTEGFIQPKNGARLESDPSITVISGALEGSNVNAVEQMVAMISASRDFDSQMKILATVDGDSKKLEQLLQE